MRERERERGREAERLCTAWKEVSVGPQSVHRSVVDAAYVRIWVAASDQIDGALGVTLRCMIHRDAFAQDRGAGGLSGA